MEVRDYINILKRNLALIIIATVIFAALALVMTLRQKTTYQSSISIAISSLQATKQSDLPYYQYDNYYATQVATTLSDNVVGWMSSPSMVAEIYQAAGYPLPSGNLRELGKIFTAKKKVATATVIDIGYSSTDDQQSEKLMSATADVLKKQIESNNSANESAKFKADATTPVVIIAPKPYALNIVIAALVGLFISVGVAFLGESLKK